MSCHKNFHFVLDFKIPSKGLSAGAIVGIVAGSCVLVILILLVLRKKGFLGGQDPTDKGMISVQNEI